MHANPFGNVAPSSSLACCASSTLLGKTESVLDEDGNTVRCPNTERSGIYFSYGRVFEFPDDPTGLRLEPYLMYFYVPVGTTEFDTSIFLEIFGFL